MIYGYARVSTQKQSLEYQLKALQEYSCDKIYQDTYSGKTMTRDGLDSLLLVLNPNDTVVVTKFDRLGRNLKGLIEMFELLQKKEVRLISLTQGFDTGTATGKLLFNLMAVLAEFERELTKERTYFALQRAKQTKKLGRPPVLTPEKIKIINELKEQGWSNTAIYKSLGISQKTFYRYFQNQR